MHRSVAAAALLLCGCAQGVSGLVQDGSTGRPLAGASVELSNRGWGTRDGQIVWDAEKVARTTSDSTGRFMFDESGGVALRVTAPGAPRVDTSLCAQSPMIVRVGGPYPGLRADQRLVIGSPTAARLGVTASADDRSLRIQAKGVRFVEGTGAIPAAPPTPYASSTTLDLRAACGWLFVSDGSAAVAVIQIGSLGWEQDPGQPQRLVLLYTPLTR